MSRRWRKPYRLLLRLLPRPLRQRFGDAIEMVAADLWRHRLASTGPIRRAALAARLLSDLVRVGLSRRLRRADRRPCTQAPRTRGVMTALRLDLRYAALAISKAPAFSAVVIVIVALTIGANAAIFSVVDSVLLEPLPYPRPDRLVFMVETYGDSGINVAYPNYVAWKERLTIFEGIAAFDDRKVFNLAGDEPERVLGAATTADLFEVVGTPPIVGRTIDPEEDRPGGPLVVVLGEQLWRRRYGADPAVVGQPMRMNGAVYTIVGVMPASFRIPNREELWVPLATHAYGDERMSSRSDHFLEVLGRMAEGVTVEQARADLAAVAAGLVDDFPQQNAGKGATLWTLGEEVIGDSRAALTLLFAAGVTVLLVACANLTNLMLTRSGDRSRELAIRTALGATRLRVARQLITESLLLATAGGAIGLLLGRWGLSTMVALEPGEIPRIGESGIDLTVVAFVTGLTLLTGATIGLAPVLLVGRSGAAEALKRAGHASTTPPSGRRARDLLVVAEVALALVVAAAAGLLLRSYGLVARVDPGFRPDHLLTGQVSLPLAEYPDQRDQVRFWEELLERLHGVRGIESVGIASRLPLTEGTSTSTFAVEGETYGSPQEQPAAHLRLVSEGYFAALGVPVLRGRAFSPADAAGSEPVVIVDEPLAERLWPGGDALDKRIGRGAEGPWYRVVGVVGGTMHWGRRYGTTDTFYLPFRQMSQENMMLAIRTTAEPTDLAGQVRRVVWAVDPDVPVSDLRGMRDRLADSEAGPRFGMTLVATLATLALLLGGVGLYAVVGFTVGRRRREIGVRMALGASAREVSRMVVVQGLRRAAVGVAVGLIAALAGSRLLSGMLFGIEPTDPATLAIVATLVLGVAALASWVPARRASRVDPLLTLRQD